MSKLICVNYIFTKLPFQDWLLSAFFFHTWHCQSKWAGFTTGRNSFTPDTNWDSHKHFRSDRVPLCSWKVHPNVPVSLMVLIWPPAWRMSGWIDDSWSIKAMCSHACSMRKLALPEEGSGTPSPPHASCWPLHTLMHQECEAAVHKCEAVCLRSDCESLRATAWQSGDDRESMRKGEFLRTLHPQAFLRSNPQSLTRQLKPHPHRASCLYRTKRVSVQVHEPYKRPSNRLKTHLQVSLKLSNYYSSSWLLTYCCALAQDSEVDVF